MEIAARFGVVRILVVEDSEDVLFVLKTELEWMGFAVDAANDGKAGVEIARLTHPDMIVSDLRMPGIDGFEFITRIRRIQDLASTPAIALTGFSRSSEVQQALALGFTTHMVKPVDVAELSSLIRKLTEKKVQRKAS